MIDTQPYGPNTAVVRRFLQRFAALRPREWEDAAGEFERLQATRAFAAADRALEAAVSGAGREDARDAVVGPLVQLVQLAPRTPDQATAPDEVPTMHPVAEAALAALLALITRDVLPSSAFATLYAPFAALVPVSTLTD